MIKVDLIPCRAQHFIATTSREDHQLEGLRRQSGLIVLALQEAVD